MGKLLNTNKSHFEVRTSLDGSSSFDDDNRIDWERKQLKRQPRKTDVHVDKYDDEALLDAVAPIKKKGKKDHRKKRRHYVFDEDRGHVVVKRRRRRGDNDGQFEDGWDL